MSKTFLLICCSLLALCALANAQRVVRPFSWRYRTEDDGPGADEYVVNCPVYRLRCPMGERKFLGSFEKIEVEDGKFARCRAPPTCKPRFETRRRLMRGWPTVTNDLGQKVNIIRPFSWRYRTEDDGPGADEYVVNCPVYRLSNCRSNPNYVRVLGSFEEIEVEDGKFARCRAPPMCKRREGPTVRRL